MIFSLLLPDMPLLIDFNVHEVVHEVILQYISSLRKDTYFEDQKKSVWIRTLAYEPTKRGWIQGLPKLV